LDKKFIKMAKRQHKSSNGSQEEYQIPNTKCKNPKGISLRSDELFYEKIHKKIAIRKIYEKIALKGTGKLGFPTLKR